MRLHVVDGTFELFRAQYSKRPERTAPDGMNVKGTVGVVASMLGLLDDPEENVTHIAVAFATPIESFRNDLFAGYKTGEGMDPVLVAQMDLVEEAVAALGITVWSMDTYEADDALATAARRWRDQVAQVRILTPDKDLGQCVTGNRVVQVDRMRRRVIDEDGVRQRNGCDPASIPDWLALVGDTADGIPGIPGFGAKTASALLSRYGTVEAIPAHSANWDVSVRGGIRLAQTLNEMRTKVALYKRLAILAEDVPLTEDLEDLRWRGTDREEFERLDRRLGGGTMRPRRWRGE
ncbi:MAG: flap endonuclease [Gammaproteobacteria bacterium]|nr:flap endonuclease [Gammaproteobacteria bacterium]